MDAKYEYIEQVYRLGSFTKAAEKLFISQPSLSAAVKKVERQIGAPIFDRCISPVRLTPAGELFIAYLERQRQNEQLLQQELWALQGLQRGRVRVGACTLGLTCLLPMVLRRMLDAYPGIAIEPVEADSAHLLPQLLSGELDLMVDAFQGDEPGVTLRPLVEGAVLLATPAAQDAPPALAPYCRTPAQLRTGAYAPPLPDGLLETLLRRPFILLKPENGMYQRASRLFAHYGVTPNVRLQFDQLETALKYTAAGLGSTLVMDIQFLYDSPGDNLHLYTLPEPFARRMMHIGVKKGRTLSPACRTFMDTACSLLAAPRI